MPEELIQPNGSASLGARILLLETDEGRGEVLRCLLRSLDCRVRSVGVVEEAAEVFSSRAWDAVFCDMAFSGVILPLAKAANPRVQVILFANYDEVSKAQELVASGEAFGWFAKPIRTEKALQMLRQALAERPAPVPVSAAPSAGEETKPSAAESQEKHFGLMIGESAPMQELYRQIQKVADSDMTVLILGESGTGKELIAKSIHSAGPRANRPFIPVNCSSLPENLLESELFGYVKGAFTGAVHNKDGLFVAANGGTLFLDEIGSIPLPTQMALLRALQEREIRPVGATQSIPVDVRVLAATNENVEKLKEEGKIRQDLFYRISAFTLRVPSLRERENDLDLLVRSYLEETSRQSDGSVLRLADDAWNALRQHPWPGNIRELRHALERGATLAEDGIIRRKDLPDEFQESPEQKSQAQVQPAEVSDVLTLKAYLRICERHYLQKILREQQGDKEQAARLLGISVATIYRKLSEI